MFQTVPKVRSVPSSGVLPMPITCCVIYLYVHVRKRQTVSLLSPPLSMSVLLSSWLLRQIASNLSLDEIFRGIYYQGERSCASSVYSAAQRQITSDGDTIVPTACTCIAKLCSQIMMKASPSMPLAIRKPCGHK